MKPTPNPLPPRAGSAGGGAAFFSMAAAGLLLALAVGSSPGRTGALVPQGLLFGCRQGRKGGDALASLEVGRVWLLQAW